MTWISTVLDKMKKSSINNRSAQRRLQISELESRTVPAVVTWTGLGADSNWSTVSNWDNPPSPNDDLVFATGAARLSSINDFTGGTSFASITINDHGYSLSGNDIVLTGNISAAYNTGFSGVDFNFQLGGAVSVTTGGELDLGGVISGSNGLTLSGGGTLILLGVAGNTYTGTTVVSAGTLELAKSGGDAVTGNLSVAATGTARLDAADQISDSGVVTLVGGSTFNLNNFNETIGGLDLTGVSVATGAGTLTLNGDVTTNASITTAVISGNLDLGGATRTFAVADGAAGTDLTITAVISGTGAGIIKAGGASAMAISGNNTYDGTTTVNTGGLIVSSANALGATTAGTVVNAGATLGLQGSISLAAEPITISGNGVGNLGALWGSSGTNTVTGPITLAASSFIGAESSAPMTISGQISDGASSFALTKVRSGSLTLSAANTFDGGTTISAGTIAISNGSALGTGSVGISNGTELDLFNDITFSRDISFRGTGVSNKGALRSVSGNNVYSGTATILANNTRIKVDAGQLDLSGTITDGGNNFAVDKYGAGVLNVSGTSTSTGSLNAVEGDLRITGSHASTVKLAGGNISGTGTVGDLVSTSSSGTVSPGTGSSTFGTLTTQGGYVVASGNTTKIDIGGTSAGTTYDQIVNSTSGGVDISSSTLSVSFVNGFTPAVGDVFVVIDKQNSGSVTGTFLNLAEGDTIQSGNVTYQVSYVGGTGNDVTLTVTAVIVNWTGLGGDGNWSTASNWDSNTAPSGGEDLVFPAGASRLSNNNDLVGKTFHSINIAGGGYDISGNAVTLSNGLSATFSSDTSEFHPNIALTSTETVNVVDGGDLILSGAISGAGFGITKTGGGTLEYTGFSANTYTGTTTVDGGTLILNRASGLNAIAGNLVVGDGAGIDIVQLGSSNQIANGATVFVASSGTFDLSGASDTVGGLDFTGGTMTTGAGMVTLASGGTIVSHASSTTAVLSGNLAFGGPNNFFTIDQGTTASGVDLDVTAVVSSGNNIIKGGAGTLAFSAVNTYSGGTNINAGTFAINHDTGAGTGVVNILGTGTLDVSGNITANNDLNLYSSSTAIRSSAGGNTLSGNTNLGIDATIDVVGTSSSLTFSGTIDDSNNGYGLNKAGTGTLILAAQNTYTGGTTATNGFLEATADNAFGASGVPATVAIQSGATLELAGGITIPSSKTISISGVPVSNTSKIMSVSGDNTIQGDIPITGGNNVAFDVTGGTTLTVSGTISGSRDFDKNNTGTLVLTGTNTNTGNVNVGDGTLIVNGSLASSNSVFADGVVGGTGTLPNTIISGIGTLNPGQGPGIINTANVDFTDGSTFSVELNGTTAGTQYDQLNVVGGVTIGMATLNLSAGFTPATGDTFTIVNNDSSDAITGTFNGLAEGSTITVGSRSYQISYVGGDGNDVTLTVMAGTYTWLGLGGDSNWTTGANWDTGTAPLPGDKLVFASGSSRTTSVNDFAAGTTFDSITIQSSGYSFSGNSIRLTHGITTTYASATSTISNQLILNADVTIDVATGGTLVLQASISGAHKLTKVGGGTLNFSALSSFSGGTLVDVGTVNLISSTTQLGSGAVTVTSGATLGFNGSASLPNALTVGGTGVGGLGALRTYGNSSSDVISGAITLTADLLVNVASQSQIAFNGAIGGAYGITTTGGGTISMAGSGSNTFTGTFVQGNTFVVVAKSGGALAIPGNLTINSGTFLTQRDEQISDTGILTVQTGAEFDLLNSNEKIGGIDFTGGIVTSNSTVLTIAAGGTITTHAASSTAGLLGTIDLSGGTVTMDVAQGTPSNGNDLAVTATIRNGSLVKNGAGKLALAPSVSSTYAGGTTINAGIVLASKNTSFGTGSVTNNSEIDLSSSITVANAINSNGTIKNTNGANTLSGVMTLLADESIDVATSTSLIISGVIDDGAGTYGLTKSGAGKLQLDGAETYNGATTLNAGTLLVNGSLVSSSGIAVNNSGKLGGSGTASAVTVASGGSIAPGASPGLLGAGDTSLVAGSTFAVELNGLTAGSQYDQLNVVGGVTLGGATLNLTTGFTPSGGDTFTIINNDGSDPVVGTFNGLSEGATLSINSVIYRISYAGGTGNDVTLTTLATSSTAVSVDQATPGFGDSITLTATVTPSSGTATGTVNFYEGMTLLGAGTLNGSGVATLTISTLTRGLHSIFADYTAQGNTLASSSTPVSVTVTGASTTTLVTTTNPSVTTIEYGDSVTFTALVSSAHVVAGIPTGTVFFESGSTLLGIVTVNSIGIATFTTSSLPASVTPYSITARYVASALDFTNSISATPVVQTVNKATLTVTADNITREFGTLNPTLTASFTGFKNGEILGSSDVTGAPQLTTTATQSSSILGGPYAITIANGTLNSGNYQFSFTDGLLTVITAVNHRPALDTAPAVIVEILPENPLSAFGAPVSRLTANIVDSDFQAVKGIAISSAPSSNLTGRWEFSTDSGVTWRPVTGVSTENALLLADLPSNRVRFMPNSSFNGFARLGYTAWDTTNDLPTTGTNPSYGNSLVGSAYGTATEVATVAVGRTSPMIDINGNTLFTSIPKNIKSPAGNLASAFLGDLISAADKVKSGIAVTSLDSTHGTWQYYLSASSLNSIALNRRVNTSSPSATTLAGRWITISGVSDSSALLLSSSDRIRFVPDTDYVGQATMRYHAWDKSVGQPGDLAALPATAFSLSEQSAVINVLTKPVLDISVPRTLANAASTTTVSSLLTGVVSDVIPDTKLGIAVTSVTGYGAWTYRIGSAPAVTIHATPSTALLLPEDAVLQYTPINGVLGLATLQYRVWNQDTNPARVGSRVLSSGIAFSNEIETLSLYTPQRGVNSAPVVRNNSVSLGSISEDPRFNPGVSASRIAVLARITDLNQRNIVVVGADNTNGVWEYSVDNAKWMAIGTPDSSHGVALAGNAKVRFVPATNYFGTAALQLKAWDGTFGSSGDILDTTVGTAFSTGTITATVTVIGVNDSPTFDTSTAKYLPSILSGATSTSATVADLVLGASDVETDSSELGIFITKHSGPGNWQFSTDGTNFSVLTNATAFFPPTVTLRFVGTVGKSGLAALSYRVWDGSSNAASSLSSDTEQLTVEVGNTAPTLTGPGSLTTINEDPTSNTGDTVGKILGVTFQDSVGSGKGIAVTGLTTPITGEWQTSLNGGKTWTAITGLSPTTALLLPDTAKIRFVPAENQFSGLDNILTGDEPTITYTAWDQSVGGAGEMVDTTDTNLNAFSSSVTASMIVKAVFDAPKLDTSHLQTLDEALSESVDSLISGNVSSPESIVFGIAVTGITGTGVWEFSADNFATPGTTISNVSVSRALLLGGTTSIRFIPAFGFHGVATLSYKAYDVTNGQLMGPVDTNSATVGGFFSKEIETLQVNVGNQQPVLNNL